MEVLSECPACKANKFHFIRKCKDFTVSSEEFSIVECESCSLLFTNPRPSKQEIGRYYESESYISHSNTSKGLFNKVYQKVRDYSINKKISLINSSFPELGKKVLDIGCGTGNFLAACKEQGWDNYGIEPNLQARTQAIKLFDLHVLDEEHLSNNQLSFKPNIITMWHVLEHVHGLRDRLELVSKLIEDNGLLVIAVPNYTSKDAKHYGDFWAAYDVPRHLYHFSPLVLKNLVQDFGFEHVKSVPMVFDAYYVSMLSEKYKSGRNNYLKAILHAWRSNISAQSNAEKYSSVIYMFRKKVR